MPEYSKWDQIDSGSEDEGPSATPAGELAQQVLSEWIREACPHIAAGDSLRLIDFVSITLPRLGHRDNVPRAAEIIDFLEHHSPSSAMLLDVLWRCRTKDEDAGDSAERTRVMKLRSAIFNALNTLEGVTASGGARQLFDAVQDPELRRKYASNVYANERYGIHCRAVLHSTMGPPAVPAWVDRWQCVRMPLTLGISAFVMIACVAFSGMIAE